VIFINKISLKSFILSTSLIFNSCAYDKIELAYNEYPTEIGKILINKCATSGCHTTTSSEACSGLDLSSWDKLFKGSRNNSSVIPFRPDQSFLLFSVNTFHDLGPHLTPTMPLNKPSLSRQEVISIRDWILKGAPDINGNIKWENNPNRRKIYVANQGCDLVTVFDADSKLIMRTIDLGNSASTESPHDMLVSPDGKNLYVSFYAGNIIQKFNTADGSKAGELNLTNYSWHAMSISGDSKFAIVSHWNSNGQVALIDLNTMTLVVKFGGALLIYPHGNALNYNGKLAYITSQQGNFVYKVDMADPTDPDIQKIPLQTGDQPKTNGIYKPYEVEFSPDYTKYYVTCQGTNELRIFSASNDSLLQVIPTSGVPQLISFSEKFSYAFITCMEDTANAVTQSSVNVINTNSNSLVKTIYSGYQPRGLAVDDHNNCVWIANRNISGVGWAPHHTGSCLGRNGYVTIINMNSLELESLWKAEVSVDPYCIAIRR